MIHECHMNVNRASESQWTAFEDFEDDFRIDWWERGLCRKSGVYSPLFYFVRFLKYFLHQLQNTLEYILSNLSPAHFLPTLSNNSVSWSVSPLLLGAVLNEFLWGRPHFIWFMPFILQKASNSPPWPSSAQLWVSSLSQTIRLQAPWGRSYLYLSLMSWLFRKVCFGFTLQHQKHFISPLNYKVTICFTECWLSL